VRFCRFATRWFCCEHRPINTDSRRFWFKLAAAAIGLAVVGYAAVSFIGADSRTVVLPDGVELTLVGVKVGTNAWFPSGLLDNLFQKVFPGKSLTIAGFRFPPVSPVKQHMKNLFGNPGATFYLMQRGTQNRAPFQDPATGWFKDARATIADEKGVTGRIKTSQLGSNQNQPL
jgi:hypothetical protein